MSLNVHITPSLIARQKMMERGSPLLPFVILFFRERHIATMHHSKTNPDSVANLVPSAYSNLDTRSAFNQWDFLMKYN